MNKIKTIHLKVLKLIELNNDRLVPASSMSSAITRSSSYLSSCSAKPTLFQQHWGRPCCHWVRTWWICCRYKSRSVGNEGKFCLFWVFFFLEFCKKCYHWAYLNFIHNSYVSRMLEALVDGVFVHPIVFYVCTASKIVLDRQKFPTILD